MQLPYDGAVSPSTSEDEELRSEAEAAACWRCQALKLTCDGEDGKPCTECLPQAGLGDWKAVGCNRSELRDELQNIFPRIPGLGSNDWLLPTKIEMALEIRPIYQNPVLEIQDIDINELLSKTESRRYDAVLAFVRQYYDINTKWDNCYEPMTMEIINQGIKVQESIVRKLRPSQYTRNPEPLDEENLLIASTLRVMALCHRIMDVCGYLPNYSLKFFEDTMFLEEEIVPENYAEPSYKISVFQTFAADPGGVDLSGMLQDIVETAQRMMLRRRPEDWPVIFHILCILKLTSWKLDIDIHYICSFKGIKNLDATWDSLCRLYLATTGGLHPLVNDWDSGRYETLVGKGDGYISWFEALNKLWIKGGFEAECHHQDFSQKTHLPIIRFIRFRHGESAVKHN